MLFAEKPGGKITFASVGQQDADQVENGVDDIPDLLLYWVVSKNATTKVLYNDNISRLFLKVNPETRKHFSTFLVIYRQFQLDFYIPEEYIIFA